MWRDETYLLDMLIAARRAIEFTADADELGFRENRLLQHATLHCLERIGEAASKVSGEYRTTHPEIAWRKAVGMRNTLVHDYRDIDLRVVWRTVRADLPMLIARLTPLVPPEED